MNRNNIWNKAKNVCIKTSDDIKGDFDIGFDSHIPEEVKNKLRHFVLWVEENFNIPVTLWVDFEYKHYLLRRDGKRVGYIFYWSDFTSYPVFDNREEIPQIRLPVRTEHSTVEEILISFIEAVSCYFAWILNVIDDKYRPEEWEVDEVLEAYIKSCQSI